MFVSCFTSDKHVFTTQAFLIKKVITVCTNTCVLHHTTTIPNNILETNNRFTYIGTYMCQPLKTNNFHSPSSRIPKPAVLIRTFSSLSFHSHSSPRRAKAIAAPTFTLSTARTDTSPSLSPDTHDHQHVLLFPSSYTYTLFFVSFPAPSPFYTALFRSLARIALPQSASLSLSLSLMHAVCGCINGPSGPKRRR